MQSGREEGHGRNPTCLVAKNLQTRSAGRSGQDNEGQLLRAEIATDSLFLIPTETIDTSSSKSSGMTESVLWLYVASMPV